MNDIIVGVLAIAAGLLFCFRGYVAMRVIIPIWASFAGFLLGAGLVAGFGDAGFLRTAAAWIVGFGLAVVFGAIAYLYYEVSIVLAMASVGFALGGSLVTALGVRWSWVVILVGIAAGAVLAAIAIATDLPAVLLVVLTAFGGASAAVFGLMLLVGTLDTAELDSASVTQRLDDHWWWYAIYLALAVAGLVAQSRLTAMLRSTARTQWAGPAQRPA